MVYYACVWYYNCNDKHLKCLCSANTVNAEQDHFNCNYLSIIINKLTQRDKIQNSCDTRNTIKKGATASTAA